MIFRASKSGPRPGPRAESILPSTHGDDYSYLVDKYWVVHEVRPDGSLVLRTRRGKLHVVTAMSPGLRRPSWFERWLYRDRFPQPGEVDPPGMDSETDASV